MGKFVFVGNRDYMRTLCTFPFSFAGNSKLLSKSNLFFKEVGDCFLLFCFLERKKKSFVKLWDNFKKSNLCVIGAPKE